MHAQAEEESTVAEPGEPKQAGGGAKSTSGDRENPAAGVEAKTVAELREALRRSLIRPGGMMLLSRDRIEDALGEAVKRGQITATGARNIAGDLIERGRKQTGDVLGDLEQLLGRARRSAGVGSSFPISGYDDLTAVQVQARLSSLTPAQLRKVRDHERRNANRKTVLSAIERKLG